MQKIKRKKLQEEERIFVEEIEKSMEEDRRSFHVLETEKADQMVLLIKCPPRVAKAWRDLSSSSSSSSSFSSDFVPLAKYFDSVDLLSPDLSPELTIEMVGAEFWNISKLYSISKSKDFIPMSIFSEANQGKVSVEGTVTNKLDMIPHCGIEEYGKLCRERNRKDRQIHVLDNCRGEHLTPKPVMVKKKKLKQCVKRTRGDRSEVEAKMFELFERQPKWTLKQLVQETNQPMQFLKEILEELCVYNASDGHTHELKTQYKYTGEEDTTFAQ